MKLKHIFLTLAALAFFSTAQAQVKVGANPGTINPSAALEIESTNKGFLPPRVALTSTTDVTTIPNPATGLIVYNTANAGSGTNAVMANQLYAWNGTYWNVFETRSLQTADGTITKKLLQIGEFPDGNAILQAGDFEFRMLPVPGTSVDAGGHLEARLITPPPANISVNYFHTVLSSNQTWVQNNYFRANLTLTASWSPANAWTGIAELNTGGAIANTVDQIGEERTTRFAYNGKVYIVRAFASGPSGSSNTWVIIVNVY